jgi:hypothetical protein
MNSTINEKIKELFESTPKNISVAFGKKSVAGELTGELAFMFMVPEKLPLSEIPENEILPSTVVIGDDTYKTDVIEVGEIKLIACDSNTNSSCYGWQSVPPSNQNTIRPIKGGIQISSHNNSLNYPSSITVGTLGFIAIDAETSALVGVSNNHVLVKNAFYTGERNVNGATIENEIGDNVYQNGFDHSTGGTIGKVIRYVPLTKSGINQVDGALFAIYSNVISNSQSFLQHGLSISTPMPFASTSEINNALVGDYPLASSGRSTGAKMNSPCGLVVNSLGAITYVGPFHDNGAYETPLFNDLIAFSRENADCNYPIYPGDSGSGLLANIDGTWKIIGLCFAGSNTMGYACRIDHVASQLGIQSWDGTSKPFIDINSIDIKAVPGTSTDKTIDCNGTTYWQMGSANNTNFC